jgi:hypothetical protein
MKTALPPLICLRMFFSCYTLLRWLAFSRLTMMGLRMSLSFVKLYSEATTSLLLPE